MKTDKPTGIENVSNKKEIRRLRAGIIKERSMIMGELKKKIADIENEINDLAKGLEQDTGSLLEASQNGEGVIIQSLSKSIHDKKQKLDALYSEFNELTRECENKAVEFDEKLSAWG